MLKYLSTILFYLFFHLSFSQNLLNNEIEKINNYIKSLEEDNLKEIYHGHFEHKTLTIQDTTQGNNENERLKHAIENKNYTIENHGGSYLQAFSNEDGKYTLVIHSDGIRENYFKEKYYYVNGNIIFCKIQKNLWEGQKLIWKCDYYFVNNKIHIHNAQNKSNIEVDYISEMKERKKFIDKKILEKKELQEYF